jgi:hypothetical protein
MWQKLSILTALAVVLLVGGNNFSATGYWQDSAATNPLAPAVEFTSTSIQKEGGPFMVAIDTNRVAYAIPISEEPNQPRYRITPDGERWETAAVGDFTGNGICDVVALSSDRRPNAYLYTTNQDRVFTSQLWTNNAYPQTGFYFDATIGDTTVADFDGDGRLDVAFSGRPCNTASCPEDSGTALIQVLLNKASGVERVSINIPKFFGHGEERMAGLGAADFNGDGKMDFAAQHYWNSSGNLTYLLTGDGQGGFALTTVIEEDHQGGINSLVAGDFDGDGKVDLIIGQDDDYLPGTTWFYKGDGAGDFTKIGVAYDTNPAGDGVNKPGAGFASAFYVDGDNHLDVIAAAEKLGLYWFKGTGDGKFSNQPVLINDTTKDWFKVATPPYWEANSCVWFQTEFEIHLPVLSR